MGAGFDDLHVAQGRDTGTPLLQPNDQVICQAVPEFYDPIFSYLRSCGIPEIQ
jgi:hypothetical protein